MRAGFRMQELTKADDFVHRVLFVLVWIFIIGVVPWFGYQPTDSVKSVIMRVIASIVSLSIGYLFGYRWGFWPMGFLQRNKQAGCETEKNFHFKYQRHPFDDWMFFEIKAGNQEEANTLAQNYFGELFEWKQTVMTVFYPETA